MSHVWPVSGVVTQRFGCTGVRAEPAYGSCQHFHPAIDIAAPVGTPIRASATGKVLIANWNGQGRLNGVDSCWGCGGGNVTIIQHTGLPFFGLYAHEQRFAVSAGHSVAQGQVIGYVDTTGTASGSHLHWGLWARSCWFTRGTPIDPRRVLAGGDLVGNANYDPASHIYVHVKAGANIRSGPGTNYPVYRTVTATYIGPLALVFGGWVTGGSYTVNGVVGNQWAKINLNGGWYFVAKPFVTF